MGGQGSGVGATNLNRWVHVRGPRPFEPLARAKGRVDRRIDGSGRLSDGITVDGGSPLLRGFASRSASSAPRRLVWRRWRSRLNTLSWDGREIVRTFPARPHKFPARNAQGICAQLIGFLGPFGAVFRRFGRNSRNSLPFPCMQGILARRRGLNRTSRRAAPSPGGIPGSWSRSCERRRPPSALGWRAP